MDQNNLRLNLQKAENEVGGLRIRLGTMVEVLKAARLELTAAKNELCRYRKANVILRAWRWIMGTKPKGIK